MPIHHLAVLACCLSLGVGTGVASASVAAGDAAWATRAEALSGELAEPARTEEAIRQYRKAVASEPRSLEARWKLLRAYHYAIDFTVLDEPSKMSLLDDAVALGQESVDRIGKSDASPKERARVLFWSSIAWGVRAQHVGLLTIVRDGVASRMHDLAEESLALDPSVDDGGALRLLARLHATVPYVPFVSGWVDRDQALPFAERGLAEAPEHPGSRLVLALTILDVAPGRTAEARKLLETVASSEPRAEFRAEDLSIRKQARERLAELDAAS